MVCTFYLALIPILFLDIIHLRVHILFINLPKVSHCLKTTVIFVSLHGISFHIRFVVLNVSDPIKK